MRAKPTKGVCGFCRQEIGKNFASRHFADCGGYQESVRTAEESQRKAETLHHLRVQAEGLNEYWLDLEMPGSANLADLDHYLRAIWLECCGHLSQFLLGPYEGRELAMSATLNQACKTGEKLTHLYDFGTTSATIIKPAGQREGKPLSVRPVTLLMRNVAPVFPCQQCQQPAARLCLECVYEGEASGMLCKSHARKHPHENYGEPLPLVNSPRMGVCGYEGPAEPPY